MSQAIIDPEQLSAYSSFLRGALEHLTEAFSTLDNDFTDLGNTWKDEKFQNFSKVFAESKGQVNAFCKVGENFLEHLQRKEQAIREYLEGGSY